MALKVKDMSRILLIVAAVLLVMTIGVALFLLNRVVRGWRRLQAWRSARRETA